MKINFNEASQFKIFWWEQVLLFFRKSYYERHWSGVGFLEVKYLFGKAYIIDEGDFLDEGFVSYTDWPEFIE
jgi:hypothetical protein